MKPFSTVEAKNDYFHGKTVTTTYNNRTYRFKQLSKLTPTDKFQYNSEYISFADYLLEKHSTKVKDMKQSLIQVVSGYETKKDQNNEDVKVEKICYLVPEHCRFSAQLLSIQK